MRIEVTQEDIERGIRASGNGCMLALAIARATGQPTCVAGGKCELGEVWPLTEIQLPPIANKAYRDFDQCLPVFPFTFDLDYEPLREAAP